MGQVTAEEFAKGLCGSDIADLADMKTNRLLGGIISEETGQIAVEPFVWTFAKPALRRLFRDAGAAYQRLLGRIESMGPGDIRVEEAVTALMGAGAGSGFRESYLRYRIERYICPLPLKRYKV